MSDAHLLITENMDVWTTAIKKRSATGRGSNKKIELTGIKKLRGLVLELAVRGKLVPQDPNDEPASVLLEKIAAEKAQLIKDKKIKEANVLPEIRNSEKSFELPVGWGFRRFIDVLDFSGGGQPPKSAFIEEKLAGYVQLIQIRDLGPYPQPIYVPESKVSKFCTPQDVMIGRYGASVGKVFWGKDGAYNVALIKIHNDHNVYFNGFIFNLMTSPLGQNLFSGISRSAQNGFSKNDIAPRVIPIPPLAEQHRIVAKVDELMALCDQLEQQTEDSITAHQTLVETLLATLTSSENTEAFNQSWARIAEHFDTLFTTEHSIDQLKQTILQLAVMGKLVPQDPNDEPASVLLEKIAAEKEQLIKDKKIKKQKPLPVISEDEKPFELPSGWEWSRMGDLAQYQKGYAFKSKDYLDSGLMITKIQNLTDNHTQNSVFITPEKIVEFEQYLLIEGDIVMTTVGSWFSAPISAVGRSFLINNLFDNSLLNQNAVRIKSLKDLDPMYLYLCVNSTIFKNYLVKEAQGTANQASITQVSIKNYLICVPPKEEQHRIVKKVDELMILCDQLKSRISEAQTTQLNLADTLAKQVVT